MIDPFLALLTALAITTILLALFWPERGLVPRWEEARRLTTRVLSEDALKHIHKCELDRRRPTLEGIAGALQIPTGRAAEIISRLENNELATIEIGEIGLTPTGRDYALRIIRAHRLWERYLADETGFTESEWHPRAERLEHTLTETDANTLAAQLGHPTHDPHGDPIPTRQGEIVTHGGVPLPKIALDQPARIVHIEDEPNLIYEQLVAEGLYPGMEVRLTEISPRRVRFWTNGDEHILAPLLANNISVAPIEEAVIPATLGIPLSTLHPGQKGKVLHVSRAVRGAERRRLMDLGLLPGTVVKAEMRSPGNDPTAYRIRGALIALREEQAKWIKVEKVIGN
ncbi:MAG: DtxR family transcriptional regulator [Anaerolineales bacterium]